ncbi:urea ABC transporter ATP-binding protein UrtD [Prochlorothrix hollandica]|uniref:Urea ABC transporter ATP-binding protein n=1 Tax=Prochlorothrix hollandica PCC 9006 = CALU 1027 TaxID=317619 RepID=A0A0M2PXI3_PROHO|nr:urea ABC transporter ATP-binding protein UrtD [Prochlorothrix hollandica]KKI99373.1 urea ABC transporter ATP-binding protein [Prochlorothrix hollandica PCC 9006 = CALU 1027]
MPKILEINNLTVSFDGFKALNRLNFSMEPGELRVIIGPNGAGKTTFLDVITGKVKPTLGEVRFKGKDLRQYSEHEIAQLGIGRKFQTPRVYLNLTPRENLELSCNRKKGVLMTLFRKTPPSERQTVNQLLHTIGLVGKADVEAGLLSHGEKQWLEIGMLVAQAPDLLLVDEPVAGLTDEETERTGELLIALAQNYSVVVIEHDMEFVRQIAKKVTVLHEGSVLCEGSMDQIQSDPRVIEVYLGQAPTISEAQLAVLRIAAAMAWADRNFAPVQQEVILSRLSRQFAPSLEQQKELRQELRNYLSRNLPLEELTRSITTSAQRHETLALSYEIISSNLINEQEAAVYQNLIRLLELTPEEVRQIEASVKAKLSSQIHTLEGDQVVLLQIAASMAWADGQVEPAEVEAILQYLCGVFASDAAQEQQLRAELPDLLLRHIPPAALVPELTTLEAREMALRLSYQVMQADNEVTVNEMRVYQELVSLLDLAPDRIQAIEAEVKAQLR